MIETTTFNKLAGENIYFMPLSIDQAEDIHSFASDKDVSRFIGWQLMNTLNDTRKHIEGMIEREAAGTHLFASVALKSTNEIIGTAIIFNFDKEANHAEVGYVFHKSYWGKGYGAEAVQLMTNFAFQELKLHKLHARVVEVNIGSILVLQKNGYVLEGRLRDYYFIDGTYYDGLILGKLHPNLSIKSIIKQD